MTVGHHSESAASGEGEKSDKMWLMPEYGHYFFVVFLAMR